MLSLFNNLRSVARFSGFTSLSPTPCNALGVDDAYLIGSGLSLAGGLFSGLFGSSAQKSTNRTNYKIWLQQQDFNRQEAEKQRQWQQLMQNLYGTSSAKANDLRSAGLNAKLGDVSASSIGSGASASLSSLPEMRPYNVGADISMGINNAASTFYHGYQAETERLSQQSQQDVNDTLVNLNKMRADTEKLVRVLSAQSNEVK
jgi:hypothetical protein